MQKFFYCTENRLRFRSLSWMVTVPILGTDLHPNYIQFNQGIRVRIRNQWKNRLNVVPWYRNPSLSRDPNPTPAVEISHKVVKSRFYCTRVSTLDQTAFFVSWGETVQSVDIYVKAMFHLKMDICPRFLWERSHDLDIVNSYCGVALCSVRNHCLQKHTHIQSSRITTAACFSTTVCWQSCAAQTIARKRLTRHVAKNQHDVFFFFKLHFTSYLFF